MHQRHRQSAWTRTWTCKIDKDMSKHHGHGIQHGNGHAEWSVTWTCSIDTNIHGYGMKHAWPCSMEDTYHGLCHATWTWTWTGTVDMDIHHGCRNADKTFSPVSLVFREFTMLSPASAFPASWSVRYRWTRTSPLVPSYVLFNFFKFWYS
jgi:hypothetical protein